MKSLGEVRSTLVDLLGEVTHITSIVLKPGYRLTKTPVYGFVGPAARLKVSTSQAKLEPWFPGQGGLCKPLLCSKNAPGTFPEQRGQPATEYHKLS